MPTENEGLQSYIARRRQEGKPLQFTNMGPENRPESWGGQEETYYRPEQELTAETEAELKKRGSGFDYSNTVINNQTEASGPGAGTEKSRGYHLNQAMTELQQHIPGIIQHTLNGKKKPTTDAEKKAVTRNIQQFFNLLKSDIEKQAAAESSAMTDRGREFKNYQGYSEEDKAAYERLYGKKGADTDKFSFADKEQYKYLIGRLKELDEKLGGEFSADLNDEERSKIQNDRKTILDGLSELESTSAAGGNRGRGGGMQRSSSRGPGPKAPSSVPDKRAALKQVMESGASREDIQAYIKENPNASTQDFINHFHVNTSENDTPDIKNTPVNAASVQAEGMQQPQGMQRNKVPYNNSMTASPTEDQKQAAVQELTDLSHKLGVGPGNWKALGSLAKDMGGWAWESYQNALNALVQGQQETRQQLPGYGK